MDKTNKPSGKKSKITALSLTGLLIRCAFTAVTNGYAQGFLQGKIYRGKLKLICMPGLNCYSCPGALGSCPIGSLQAVLGSGKLPLFLLCAGLSGAVWRGAGAVCLRVAVPLWAGAGPAAQDPTVSAKKKRLPGRPGAAVAQICGAGAGFVILLPLTVAGISRAMGEPVVLQVPLPERNAVGGHPAAGGQTRRCARRRGWLFDWKVLVLLAVRGACQSKFYRPFCRYLCPLGAIYGLFNPIALYRYRVTGERLRPLRQLPAGVRDGHPRLGKAEQHRVHPLRQVQGGLPDRGDSFDGGGPASEALRGAGAGGKGRIKQRLRNGREVYRMKQRKMLLVSLLMASLVLLGGCQSRTLTTQDPEPTVGESVVEPDPEPVQPVEQEPQIPDNAPGFYTTRQEMNGWEVFSLSTAQDLIDLSDWVQGGEDTRRAHLCAGG